MPFNRICSEIKISSLRLKNRMVMPAIHHAYTTDGLPTERFNSYYWRRAEGGVGLVIVGSCRFDGYGAKSNSMSLADDGCISPWRNFTDGMHARGCPVAVQLYHAGRYMPRKDVPCGGEPLAPSETYCAYTRETAGEMSLQQIGQLVQDYADGARRAKAAGFDAVEISASSGYLLCQFMSPLTNLRTDEYGGSFEKRCSFPLRVIAAVREAVGEGYPIIYRLSADDLVPGSCTLDDILRFVPMAEAAGVDCFNVTGGWHESKVPQLTGDVPRGGFWIFSRSVREKAAVPVIQSNRINTPYAAEKAIALGDADLVGIGRACLADPDFALKLTEGRVDEIRPCVACNQGCLSGAFFDRPVTCHVNAMCGRESIYLGVGGKYKRVLVVGGGPAGCEAALRAAQYGHSVELWEKENALGGQLRLAAAVPGKQELAGLIAFYEKNLPQNGVKVRLGKTAAAEKIHGFDKVLLATGGLAKESALKIAPDSVPVYSVEDILSGRHQAGENVAVIGGSFVGCELSRYLAREASLSPDELYYLGIYNVLPAERLAQLCSQSRRSVTIFEAGKKIGVGYEAGTAWTVLQDLDRLGVVRQTNTSVSEVRSEGLLVKDAEGEERLHRCDSVVIVKGLLPDRSLLNKLHEAGIDASVIGNADTIGRSINAIRRGCEAAALI